METPDFEKPEYEQFKNVFNHFISKEEDEEGNEEDNEKEEEKEKNEDKSSDSDSDDDEPKEPVIGKKKLKKMNRLTVAELKQLVSKPEVVEVKLINNYKYIYIFVNVHIYNNLRFHFNQKFISCIEYNIYQYHCILNINFIL